MSPVRPLIEYASCAWDLHNEQLIAEVEKIQRRAARFVLSDYESYEPGSRSVMFKKLGGLSTKRAQTVLNFFYY